MIVTQESSREEASTGLQKGREVSRPLHGDQTLSGLQVPGLPEVVILLDTHHRHGDDGYDENDNRRLRKYTTDKT